MNIFDKIILYALTTTLLGAPIKVIAEEINQRIINPIFITNPPIIDGELEEIWNQSNSYGNFRKLSTPGKGEIESNSTNIRFLYDNKALYIAVQAQKLEEIVANKTLNDDIGGDDMIKVLIDPSKSGSSVYYFGSNLLNTRLDGHLIGDRSIDWDDIHWTSNSIVTDSGYAIEFKIPWDIIKLQKNTDELGINIIRNTPLVTYSETSILQYSDIGENDFSNYAIIRLPSRVEGNKLTSHITPSLTQEFKEDEKTTSLGIDNLKIRYENFSGNFTFNPSDDVIEADPHVSWNLTGDEIHLPERREFFSSVGALFSMRREYLYTRRIGNLEFGGIETYETPGFRVGLINILAEKGTKNERYDIGRVILEKKILGEVSNAGFFFINSTDKDIDKIGVVDWHIKKDKMTYDGEAARTSREGSNEKNHALWSQIKLAEPEIYETSLYVGSTGDNYNPQIGYQPINGVKGARFVITRPNINIGNINDVGLYFNPYLHIEESQYQSGKFFANYYYLSLGLSRKDGKLGGRYAIAKGKRDLENKIYDNQENIINLSYTYSPNLYFSGETYFGKSYGYNFWDNGLNINYGIKGKGTANFGIRRNNIKNSQESKQDWITTAQSSVNLTNNFILSTNLRYTSLHDELIANARIGYIPTPSTEIYLWTTSQTNLNNNNTNYQTNVQLNYTFDITK